MECNHCTCNLRSRRTQSSVALPRISTHSQSALAKAKMTTPFGFSVGDFISVGKLIGQVAVELREVCWKRDHLKSSIRVYFSRFPVNQSNWNCITEQRSPSSVPISVDRSRGAAASPAPASGHQSHEKWARPAHVHPSRRTRLPTPASRLLTQDLKV